MAAPALLRLEEAVQHALAQRLHKRGRAVEVRPFPGFGAGGWVRVGGRVVIAATKRAADPPSRLSMWSAARTNLAQFVTFEVPYAHVQIDLGGQQRTVSADREGYVSAELTDVDLAPGRHPVTLTPVDPQGQAASGIVHVPDPHADIAVVSDIDDTIIDSGIARGLLATISTALLRDAATRVPLEGVAQLYQALASVPAGAPARPFFYLSTSPWNLAGFLGRFIKQHGFPVGPLLLTDWGPGNAGLFRIATRAHKLAALRDLAQRLPDLRFVLLGDSGQEDVEIYTAFALECPGRVAAIYIRRAGVATAVKQQRIDRSVAALRDIDVPFVLADDSASMLRHAQQHGLVTAPAPGG